MNENTMNISGMEQELFTVRSKYKPYFELENETRKLKIERMKLWTKVEGFLLGGIAVCIVELVYEFFIM